MGTYYNGDHAILFMNSTDFNNYITRAPYPSKAKTHSWNDWYLIPGSRPVIAMPKEKTKTVDIPGMHGYLDLSELLTGHMMYNNRQGSLQFIVDNDHMNWMTLQEKIISYIHGQNLKMILTDDPEYYYEGRFWFDQWRSEAQNSSVVIRYDVYPYKRHIISTVGEWLWDPFNFETGIITRYKDLTVSGSLTVVCINGDEIVTPIITCSAAMTLTFGGKNYSLVAGANTPVTLNKGSNSLKFTGNGTVSINYRRGYL